MRAAHPEDVSRAAANASWASPHRERSVPVDAHEMGRSRTQRSPRELRGHVASRARESQSTKLTTCSRDGLAILGVASSRDPWRGLSRTELDRGIARATRIASPELESEPPTSSRTRPTRVKPEDCATRLRTCHRDPWRIELIERSDPRRSRGAAQRIGISAAQDEGDARSAPPENRTALQQMLVS